MCKMAPTYRLMKAVLGPIYMQKSEKQIKVWPDLRETKCFVSFTCEGTA